MALALVTVLLSALAAPAAKGQTYNVLYTFTGGSDGAFPYYGSLVQDKAGSLYGTTQGGGSSGYGTVFKVTQGGTETVLYSFTGGADGGYPYAGLVLSGNALYGNTTYGGSEKCYDGYAYGCGVVFEVNIKARTETVLHTFTGGSDGGYPWASLVEDDKGNLYGTTEDGGASGYGAVFEVVPKTKKETVLHSLDDKHGAYPYSGLTLNTTERVLFGTTRFGGSSDSGVVFSLAIGTGTYNVLYNFTGWSDGGAPWGTLALDPSGNLYGTTLYGGSDNCTYGCGTVFKVVPRTKKESVLYSFPGGASGYNPYSGVIRDKKGNLYGTALRGGSSDCIGGCGTVFDVVKGAESVLHTFDGSDGAYPFCGLTMDSKGNLYGTTYTGGSDDWGVVWEITP
jgi:uncharacterized repeat protein (TIGR03803 family)